MSHYSLIFDSFMSGLSKNPYFFGLFQDGRVKSDYDIDKLVAMFEDLLHHSLKSVGE